MINPTHDYQGCVVRAEKSVPRQHQISTLNSPDAFRRSCHGVPIWKSVIEPARDQLIREISGRRLYSSQGFDASLTNFGDVFWRERRIDKGAAKSVNDAIVFSGAALHRYIY